MNGSMLESSLLETHFDIIPFGIYVVDLATMKIVFINRHFRDRLGDLTGRTCHQALYGTPQPCHFCKLRSLINKDGSPNGHIHIFEMFNDKDDRWYQLQEKAMSWPDGRIVKYSIAVDISELKETQNRLAEAHARLALTNKDLQDRNEILQENIKLREHVDRISRHDLKSPLNGMINLPQVLLERFELPDEAVSMIKIIKECGLTMLTMINRSMDLYRLEVGSYQINHEPVDLVRVARRAAAALAAHADPRGQSVKICLREKPAGTNETFFISGESLLCQTMLMNLVKNAMEAAPSGSEIVVDMDEADGMARISVANAGELPEKARERFFEKYFTAGKRGGAGLGTYSARLAAEAHGGRMELDLSRPGLVRVVAFLPLHDQRDAPGTELGEAVIS